MNRLDEVFGIANWRNAYEADPQGGKLCRLSVRIGGEWITKVDGEGTSATNRHRRHTK